MPTAEDEEREQLAKEMSKDWSAGNPFSSKKENNRNHYFSFQLCVTLLGYVMYIGSFKKIK